MKRELMPTLASRDKINQLIYEYSIQIWVRYFLKVPWYQFFHKKRTVGTITSALKKTYTAIQGTVLEKNALNASVV